ncbi:two component transcriptional regulator, LuxR family [Paenibacillus sp. UNCCL117]|uniref:response regulator transcription factor n=1 Tax=unclassified Paenibacillus TaxID=185978 RepID=UPI0008878F04|nr:MULTISPECIES: response regulator transcription factor [unclassified Paenibacillus]SDE69252.1 DNA-binding response regulator, NarL/FixJ family, contains REC and HTH domains [Paenibacillus sp. cl123]SFW71046.1 two component transcriptional regulator, LuxR family [Paenibacillus sp. UNCCL117]
MTQTIKIIIADDHPLFLHGLTTLFSTVPDLEIVGEAMNGEEAVRLAASLKPDVILMDIRMPGLNGIEATRTITSADPNVSVLIFTMFQDDASVFTAMRAGAKGYVLKDAEKGDLLRAIRSVSRGEAIFSPSIASRMIDYFATTRPAAREELFPELTVREREVLYLMADGESNVSIATKLGLSSKTVMNYVTNILNKLQVQRRKDAMRLARESRFNQVE